MTQAAPTPEPATQAALRRTLSPGYRAWVLTVLMLVAMFGFADRQILSALGQAIKRDLVLSDAQLGLLGGLAFALLNALASVPLARLADRGRRVTLVSAGVFVWSIATALCGLTVSFGQLIAARLTVGLGEATGNPATVSMLADYFPRQTRTSAMAFFGLSVPLGALLGAAGGGYIAQHASWRSAFIIAGLPGILLGLVLAATVREPVRGHYDGPSGAAAEPPPLLAVLKRMIERPAFLHTLIGSTLVSTGGFGILTFNAPYLFRRFGLDLAQAGLITGLISAVPGCICILGAGLLADRLARRDVRFYGWAPALCALLATPLYVVSFLQTGWLAATLMLMTTGLVQYAYLPVSMGLYQNLMAPRMRASAAAIVNLATNLVSAGLGPLIVGLMSDAFAKQAFHGDFAVACSGGRAAQSALQGPCGVASASGLQWACILFSLIYLWGAAHFALAARTLKRDMA